MNLRHFADVYKRQVIDILQTGMYQIDRIEHFTENMRKMSHLEQRELQCSEIELSELAKKIEAEACLLYTSRCV